MYMKFNVHSSNANQLIGLEVADRRASGTARPHDNNRHPTKF